MYDKINLIKNREQEITTEFNFKDSFRFSEIKFFIPIFSENPFNKLFVDFLNLITDLEYENYILVSDYEKLYFYNNYFEDFPPDLEMECEVNKIINDLTFEIIIRQDLLSYKPLANFFNLKTDINSLLVI